MQNGFNLLELELELELELALEFEPEFNELLLRYESDVVLVLNFVEF
jgi:hypothetical protein